MGGTNRYPVLYERITLEHKTKTEKKDPDEKPPRPKQRFMYIDQEEEDTMWTHKRWNPHDLNFHPSPTTMGCAAPKAVDADGNPLPCDAAGRPMAAAPVQPVDLSTRKRPTKPLWVNDSPVPDTEMRENSFRKLVYK